MLSYYTYFMDTCKRQWFSVGQLPGLQCLLLFLQSVQHVAQIQLNRCLALLYCCFGECLLPGGKAKAEQDVTYEPAK